MRRLFVTNLLFILAVNALVKPAYILGVDRLVYNRVGEASYGIYQALVNLGLMFNVLLDFGLANYNVRRVAAAPEALPDRLPSLLTSRILLNLLFSAVVMGVAFVLGYRGAHLALLGGIVCIQVLSQAHLFFRSCLSGLHRFRADSLLSVADKLLMLVVCTVLLTYPGFSLRWFVGAQLFCYLVALVAGMVLLRRFSPVQYRFSFRLGPVWAAIRESAPYALITFLMSVYLRADTMLIERLAGAQEAGRYAAAYRLLDVGQMFGLTFASLLLPLYGKQLALGEPVQPLVRTSLNLLLPVALLVAVVGLFYGTPLMSLLYGQEGHKEGPIFTVLMLAFPAFCITNIYSTLLTARGDLRILNQIAGGVCILSLAANFFFISQFKSIGGAWATFLTQWTVCLLYLGFAVRKAQLPIDLKWVMQLVLFGLLALLLGYGSTWLPLPRLGQSAWMGQLACLGVGGIFLMVILRLVSPTSIRQLFRR